MSGSQEHKFMNGLISLARPKTILEIGVAGGGMTCAMIWALQDNVIAHKLQYKPKYVGLDFWEPHGLRMQFLSSGSLDNVINKIETTIPNHNLIDYKLHYVDTLNEQERVKEILLSEFPEGIDLAFIDGDHSYFGIASDFFNVWPLLSEKGIVVFHDTAVIDGCREFMHELRVNNTGEYDIIELPWGTDARNVGIHVLSKRSFILSDCAIDESCGSKNPPEVIEQIEYDYYINNIDKSKWDSIKNPKLEDTINWIGKHPAQENFSREGNWIRKKFQKFWS